VLGEFLFIICVTYNQIYYYYYRKGVCDPARSQFQFRKCVISSCVVLRTQSKISPPSLELFVLLFLILFCELLL
jgi:hypothetical protein